MKFRIACGGLADSMKTLVELEDRDALIKHSQEVFCLVKFNPDFLKVESYSSEPDTRIGWDKTYTVAIDGYGVIGYTDCPC